MPYMMVKKKIYPNVHVLEHKFQLTGYTAGYNSTIYPVIMQDEAQGDPNSKYTNPESGSFAESNEPNCYPDSRVNSARLNLELSLAKGTYVTDNVEVLRVAVIPIQTAFLENLTAINDATSEEVEDLLELQHETTDRQTYPLWNGNKLTGDTLALGTDVPGLTTNQNIEGVTLDINKLYDSLQFYTNGGKVRHTIGRIRWVNISRRRLFRMQIRFGSKTKAQNPYTFAGVLIHLPLQSEINSAVENGALTNIPHLNIRAFSRYNEWNENFNMMR